MGSFPRQYPIWFCVAMLFVPAALAQPPGENWGLMFADEFNGLALDAMKWNYNYPLGQTIKGQASMNSNQVSIQDGKLVLTAIAQPVPGGFSYISGAINTSEKLNITGGYIEGSFKMPSTEGTWPAFCTLQNTWPPEIDIVEVSQVGTNYWASYHYGPSPQHHYYNISDVTTDFQLSEVYHRFAVEWTSTYIKYYFDGVVKKTINDPVGSVIGQSQNMYLLLSLGVGGWAGDPPPGAVFPATYQCDWVHVWKKIDTNTYPSTTTWTKTGSGNWDDAQAWLHGCTPQLSTQTAVFGAVDTDSILVDWENSRIVGGIVFNSDVNYTLGSGDDDGIMMASPSGPSGPSRMALIDATGATGGGENIINARLDLYNDVTILSPNKPLILNGAIVGPGGLQVESGQIVLNGEASYGGATTLTGSTLILCGGVVSIGSAELEGSSLEINSVSASLHDITGTGALTVGNGAIAANLTVDSVAVGTLTIAAGAKLTIRPIPSGPLSGKIQSVPEPSIWILLLFATAGASFIGRRNKKEMDQRGF
jgi:beta-glucanase (GH16 family)